VSAEAYEGETGREFILPVKMEEAGKEFPLA